MNVIRYYETCPGCGAAWKYKKIKFFTCPECKAALENVKELNNYDSETCRECGAQIKDDLIRAQKGEEKNTTVFFSCRKCGRPKMSVAIPFFSCYKCEDGIVPMSKLKETEVGCCPTCGTDLSRIREQALIRDEEDN